MYYILINLLPHTQIRVLQNEVDFIRTLKYVEAFPIMSIYPPFTSVPIIMSQLFFLEITENACVVQHEYSTKRTTVQS